MHNIQHQAQEALRRALEERKRYEELIKNFSTLVANTLKPVFNEIAANTKLSKKELMDAFSKIQVNVPEIKVPEAKVNVEVKDVKVPEANVKVTVDEIKVPEIKTDSIEKTLREVLSKFKLPESTINYTPPTIRIPEMRWPEGNMPIEGLVTLKGIDKANPLPVELRDSSGNPMKWPEYIGGGSGGGGGRAISRIGGVDSSAFASYMNPDGRLRVSVETGGSGLTDTELRASSVPVAQASGAIWSVNVAQQDVTQFVNQVSGATWSVSVNDAFRTTVVSNLINSDDRLRVSVETGGSGLTDAELRATAVPVSQVSGARWSTEATQSGTWNIATVTTLTGITNSVAASIIDSSGVQYSGSNPVPVSMSATDLDIRDLVNASDSISAYQVSGHTWSVSVNDSFRTTVASSLINSDDRLRVSVETGGSGLTDSELRATAVPVSQLSGARWSTEATQGTSPWVVSATDLDVRDLDFAQDDVSIYQVSGHTWSVSVNDAFRTTVASNLINGDDRLRVSVETGGSGLTDAELRAAHLDVQQLSGSIDSVKVTGFDTSIAANIVDSGGVAYTTTNPVPIGDAGGSLTIDNADITSIKTAVEIMDDWDESDRAKVNPIVGQAGLAADQGATDVRTLRVIVAGDSITSVKATANSGVDIGDVDVTSIAAGDNNIGNVDIVTMPAVVVTSITNSIAATIIDSTGIGYSGSNPLPTTLVSSSVTSTIAVGAITHDTADDGDAPLKIGGVAVTANPTAVAGGDRVKATFDDVGRQLIRPVQVRDLIQTSYATITNGTETTLLAGSASTFHDLIYVMMANSSDVAVIVDVRAGTANGVVASVSVPANGTAGISLPVPIPQDVAANAWTVDMPDITGTTVYASALFSKEV